MTLPDKLSEAGKQQLTQQIDFFQALTARAFDNAGRIVALNLQTTRDTLEQTSGVVRQLATARDPADLAALGAQSQQQMQAVMAYGRKLMEITNKAAPPAAPSPEPVAEEHIVTAPPEMASEPAAAAPELMPDPAPVVATVAPSAHPLGEVDPQPASASASFIDAEPTPIAKAASELAAAPVETPHPAASPIPDADTVAIPTMSPVDAGIEPVTAAPKRARGTKKR